jgi:hypothetical protein
LVSRNPERRIPRQYQQPRPTVVPERRRPLLSRIPTIWRLALVGIVVCLVTPFGRFDDLMAVNLLSRVASTTPALSRLRVRVGTDALDGCGGKWELRLEKAGAKAILLVEPLDLVCQVRGAQVVRLSDSRRDAIGRIAGWLRLPTIGERYDPAPHWVRPYAASALPSVDAQSLERGHIDAEILRDKVVILTLSRPGPPDERFERAVLHLAAALSPAGERRAVSPLIVALIAVVWGVFWLRVSVRRGNRWGLLVALGGFSFVVLLSAVLATQLVVSILPLVTLSFAFLAMVATKAIPAMLGERRALRKANQLVERAALLRLRGLDQIDDAEFYARLAGLAEQWHPANIVLIAQLPAKRWHLVFWNNGSAGENLITERRRDIRRTPYCDEQGLPTIRIVRNYLAVKEMPVLVIPLVALGEIEGYVFLCGDRAEVAFRADPTVAHRMSLELAMLMRRRRLGRATMEELIDARRGSTRARAIAAGAQTVTDEMDLLGAMVREAPLGLLLADAFGHVRMVGRVFADWLSAFGLASPSTQNDALLAPGSLTLLAVIRQLTGSSEEEAQRRLAELASAPQGLTLPLRAPASAGAVPLVLRCRVLRKHALSVDHVAGFIAVLSEAEERVFATNVVALPTADELGAFALAAAVEEVVAAANHSSRRRVKFEPTTSTAQCIGKRVKLVMALRAFLSDASTHESPVVVLREKAREVELVVHDLDLGVPMGAVERVMNAPHHPPAGLESLGRLILAVEESHGSMRVADGRGWGMRLIIRLHRARSVVIAGNSRYPSAIAVAEGSSRQSIAPAPKPRSRRPPPDDSG